MNFDDLKLSDYFYLRGNNKLMRKLSVDRCYSFETNEVLQINHNKKVEKLKVSIKIERIEK